MRVLAFTDSHGELRSARAIVDLAAREQPDLIVCAGDFSLFEDRHEAFLRELARMRREILYIAGNHEPLEFCGRVETSFPLMKHVSHRRLRAADIDIAGLPGTPEFAPDWRERDEAFDDAARIIGAPPLDILVSHYPPSRTAVDGTSVLGPDSGGSHVVRRRADHGLPLPRSAPLLRDMVGQAGYLPSGAQGTAGPQDAGDGEAVRAP